MALGAPPWGAFARSFRSRPFRLKLAGVLTVFAAAGLYASSQAAAQAPGPLTAHSSAASCDRDAVRWGYEVDLVPGAPSGFSIAGVRIDAAPAGCVGRPISITYSSDQGVVRRAVVPISVGVVDRLDRTRAGAVVVTAAGWSPAW